MAWYWNPFTMKAHTSSRALSIVSLYMTHTRTTSFKAASLDYMLYDWMISYIKSTPTTRN